MLGLVIQGGHANAGVYKGSYGDSRRLKSERTIGIARHWLAKQPVFQPGSQQYNQQIQQANLPIPEPDKIKYSSLLLESHAGYDRLLRQEITSKILRGLGAGELYEPARLSRLFVLVSSTASYAQIRGNPEIFDLYEMLKQISRTETTCRTLLQDEKIGNTPKDATTELQVIDYDGKGIEPVRLERITFILVRLHTDLCHLLSIPESNLRFAYFDSGSDLVLGITAATALIATLGPLLLRFWDKARFRDQETFDKDLDSLGKGLEFMKKVEENVKGGAISDETARILTASVYKRIDELVGLGATTPLRGTIAIDQRQLVVSKRDVKLLGNGDPHEQTTEPPTEEKVN